jgi:hypothetical protein
LYSFQVGVVDSGEGDYFFHYEGILFSLVKEPWCGTALQGVLVFIVQFPDARNPCFVSSCNIAADLGSVLTEDWPGGSGVDLEDVEQITDTLADGVIFSKVTYQEFVGSGSLCVAHFWGFHA